MMVPVSTDAAFTLFATALAGLRFYTGVRDVDIPDMDAFIEARNDLDTATVFSGLLAVILIGLAVESVIFRAIEARTVNLWGMQR